MYPSPAKKIATAGAAANPPNTLLSSQYRPMPDASKAAASSNHMPVSRPGLSATPTALT